MADLRPNGTAYSKLTNQVLRERAFEFVRQLRIFYSECCEQEASVESWDASQAAKWGSVQAYQLGADKAREKRERDRQERYSRDFKNDAVLIRNEILQRLPDLPHGGIWGPGGEYRIDLSAYGSLQSIVQLDVLATHLEALAKLLP